MYEFICKNGNKILSEVELPRYKDGRYKSKLKHSDMVGINFDVEVKGQVYYDLMIVEYEPSKYHNFKVKYNNIINEVNCGNFIKGRFGGILNTYTNDFKINIGNIKDTKRDLIITNKGYKVSNNGKRLKYYNYNCNICGYKNGWIVESSLLSGSGCSCCANKIVVQGINDMYTTDYWMVELGVDEEWAKTHTSRSSKEKAPCKCPYCGKNIKITSGNVYNRKSIGCICGDGFSYPEKFMYNVLKQLNVDFETQYSPDHLNKKRSDFYIPSMKLVVETDGKLGHDGGESHSKSKKTLEECVEIDKWKDEQHLKHGIRTVRINCFESNMKYIKENILKSELINYLDLSKVDWDKADVFAWSSNLRREICKCWNSNNKDFTARDLADMFGISSKTVVDYLNKGNKIGWCNYDPKEESLKASHKSGKNNGKPVEIFKDGVTLGTFPSCAELERQSEELFGVKLLNSVISSVCNNKRKRHKGFTFKYIEDNQSA